MRGATRASDTFFIFVVHPLVRKRPSIKSTIPIYLSPTNSSKTTARLSDLAQIQIKNKLPMSLAGHFIFSCLTFTLRHFELLLNILRCFINFFSLEHVKIIHNCDLFILSFILSASRRLESN